MLLSYVFFYCWYGTGWGFLVCLLCAVLCCVVWGLRFLIFCETWILILILILETENVCDAGMGVCDVCAGCIFVRAGVCV